MPQPGVWYILEVQENENRKKKPEQTVRDIWVRSSLSLGLAEIAKEMAEVNQLSGISP